MFELNSSLNTNSPSLYFLFNFQSTFPFTSILSPLSSICKEVLVHKSLVGRLTGYLLFYKAVVKFCRLCFKSNSPDYS